MPNFSAADFEKVSVDKIFHLYKRDDLKILCRLKMDAQTNSSDQSVISKIMMLDENNHYGYAINKPFSTCCYKKQKNIPFLKELLKLNLMRLQLTLKL